MVKFMTDLHHRLSTATEGQERELLSRAFESCFSDKSEVNAYRWASFVYMLDAQAWTSAAEMLVPDGWLYAITVEPQGTMAAVGKRAGSADIYCAPFPWASLALASLKVRGL